MSNVCNIIRASHKAASTNSKGRVLPDTDKFRKAWAKFATGVSVITSIEENGSVHGMAANGIASVSLDPMLVLVCVDHRRNTYRLIHDTGRFAINILNEDQDSVAEYYARPPEGRIGQPDAEIEITDSGAARVNGSLAFMDCTVHDEVTQGDHTIFIGEVKNLGVRDGRPLIFFESKFNKVAHDGAEPKWG